MLWCCVSLQHPCSEDDDHQLGEQKHEVVVEKLAIKSIPLLPKQRLSPSPRSSHLKWQIPRYSSKASQSTQTSLSMQHLQLVSIPNYETSPLLGFTKIERIQEATNVASAFTPGGEGIRVMDCTLLFASISPQEESQHTSFILDQTSEGISNSNVHKNLLNISPNTETLIYKPTMDTSSEGICINSEPNSNKTLQIDKESSDFIHKKPFVNEDVSTIPSLTKMTSTRNIGPNGENITSNFFPSSETLLCIEELEDQTSIAQDQNVTANIEEVCENVPSEFYSKNKLLHIHSTSGRKHTSRCSLMTHKSQNSNSTDEASVSEKPATFSNSVDLKVKNLIDTQLPLSARRNIPLSVSNTDVLGAFDNSAAVKVEYQQTETKLCANTLSAPSLIAESHQTEKTFQQSIANNTDPKEDKNLESDLTRSIEKLKAETEKIIMSHSIKDITPTKSELDDKNTKSTQELEANTKNENEENVMPLFVKYIAPSKTKEIEKISNKNTKSTEELKVNEDDEEAIIPLTIKDVTSTTERNKSENQSDKNTKSIVTCMFSVNDRHPTYIHSTFNNSTAKTDHLPLQKLEPMPTFIAFSRGENMIKKKVFTPEHLSLFLATCIKNHWQGPTSKFVHSTSCKNAKMNTFSEKSRPLQTKQIASKQHALENGSKVLKQAQQNMSNFSTSHNCKKKFDNHMQFCSNIGTYIGSSKVETFKAKRKYKDTTSKTFIVKNTLGASCPKGMTREDELNEKTHLEENKCSQKAICTPNGQKADCHSANEDGKYTKSTSISSSEMLYHNCVTNSLQISEGSKYAEKLNFSKKASKHHTCATSRKGSENMLDYHSLLKSNSEPSNSAQKFTFKEGNMNTEHFERSTPGNANILHDEYNPIYLGNSETNKQNFFKDANHYQFSAQTCLYDHCKEVCQRNQNTSNGGPYSSNIIHKKIPIKCDKILMKEHHLMSCISPIQTEKLEEIKVVKQMTGYKETKKFSYSDNEKKQSDTNILSSSTRKSDSRITDVLPLSASSSYDDHSYHGRSYIPSSNPSQSSLMTIEETEEPTMCWTIIIKHVNPDQLNE